MSLLLALYLNSPCRIFLFRLGEGFSNPTLRKAFDLLRHAKIINKVPSADPSGIPLGATASNKIFKALFVDIGLMRYLTGMSMDIEYQKQDLLNIFQGAMAEQFVRQEMILSQNGNTFYWSRQAKSSTAEVDFLAGPTLNSLIRKFILYPYTSHFQQPVERQR